MSKSVRLLGLDPGLCHVGWGIVKVAGYHLSFIDAGTICPPVKDATLPERLGFIFQNLQRIITDYKPHEAAVEETFVNKNPTSALKLGMARGVIMMTPYHCGIPVFSYTANQVKKSVVGFGHSDKDQVALMVRRLLPGVPDCLSKDSTDALAIAITHAHCRQTLKYLHG